MDRLSAFAAVKHRSFLANVGEIEAFALSGASRMVEVKQGLPVPRPETASELFIVASGEVGLIRPGHDSEVVARLGTGQSLELGTFLKGEEAWKHTWIAQEPCSLLSFPRGEVLDVIGSTPGVSTYLQRSVSDVGIRRFNNDLRLLGVEQHRAVRLIARLVEVTGKLLQENYATHPGIAIVRAGTLDVEIEIDGRKEHAGTYRRGSFLYLDESIKSVEPDESCHVWYLHRSVWADEVPEPSIDDFVAIADPVSVKRASALAAPPAPAESAHDREEVDEELDDLEVSDFKVTPEQLKKLHKKKRPVVLQRDEMDCGAACMSMISRFYGRKIDVSDFRSLVHVTRDGASMLSLRKAAKTIGMNAIGVMSSQKGLRKMRQPFIALMEYHYIVVYKATEDEVVAVDPGRGLLTFTPDEFNAQWSRSALLLDPTPAFKEYPESKLAWTKYIALFKGMKRLIIEILAASLLIFLFGLALPVLLQFFVDTVLPAGDPSAALLLAIALGFVQLTGALLTFVRRYLLVYVTSKLDALSSVLFVRRLLQLPLSFFAVRTLGDITTRLGEIRGIRSIVLDQSLQVLTLLLGGAINTVILGLYSPKLLLALLAGLTGPAVFIRFFAPRLAAKLREVHKAEGEWQTRSWEQFDGLSSIKSMGAEVAARWKWNSTLVDTLGLRRDLGKLQALSMTMSKLFDQGIRVGVLLFAIYLFSRGELTAGHVLAVSLLSGVVVNSAMTLMNSWHDMNELSVSLGRIDDVVTAAAEPTGPKRTPETEHRITGRLEARNVSFQYGSETSPIVLDEISLRIDPGETVALVGRSGSGKSTLGYMFNLLYAPTKGSILFDGKPHSDIPLSVIRDQVGMIVQDNSIFSGTIMENISLGDPHPSFHKVVEAARAADAHEFIAGLPQGYLTELGESGEGLSGGQKQRINIARALYRDPRVLIMDEATSALDALSEAKIVKHLKSRKGTTIVIAHRLNTVMHADRIVVLDGGRIVEEGTHAQLLGRRGTYNRLFAKQLAL